MTHTTEALVNTYIEVKMKRDLLTDRLGRLEHAIVQQMEAEGAKALPHRTHDVKLSYSVRYDNAKLVGLLELVPSDELDLAYTPARQETAWVPEKWDMRSVLALTKFGAAIKEVIEGARITGAPRLSIKERKA